MFSFDHYVKPDTLEEAYELYQKKSNTLLGGMLWLRMEDKKFSTAIDISHLGLKGIREEENVISIGAMTSLRELEISEILHTYTCGAFRNCLSPIVGVQFRNLATIGGSIYGRYGFSDPLTLFLSLDAKIKLYKKGIISLNEFCEMKPERDIITEIIIEKKKNMKVAYQSQRNTKTDFPVLTCCVAISGDETAVSVGARPGRAKRIIFNTSEWTSQEGREKVIEHVRENMIFGSNMRAGKEYRKEICGVLIDRCFNMLEV